MTYTIKDVSRTYTSYSSYDGSGQEDIDEEYVVLDARGIEVYRTCSLIKAQRWVARLNSEAKRRVA